VPRSSVRQLFCDSCHSCSPSFAPAISFDITDRNTGEHRIDLSELVGVGGSAFRRLTAVNWTYQMSFIHPLQTLRRSTGRAAFMPPP
jgi:hypothetical protein